MCVWKIPTSASQVFILFDGTGDLDMETDLEHLTADSKWCLSVIYLCNYILSLGHLTLIAVFFSVPAKKAELEVHFKWCSFLLVCILLWCDVFSLSLGLHAQGKGSWVPNKSGDGYWCQFCVSKCCTAGIMRGSCSLSIVSAAKPSAESTTMARMAVFPSACT